MDDRVRRQFEQDLAVQRECLLKLTVGDGGARRQKRLAALQQLIRRSGSGRECQGEQQDDWPHAFTWIEIRFVIGWEPGFTPDEALVEKALDMACNRYCPVDATLTNGTRISHRRVDA